MKRIINLILVVSLFALCIAMFTSCKSELPQPDDFTMDERTLTLSWDKVRGAMAYLIQVEGENREKRTQKNSLSLEYLDPGTYEIKIKAVGDNVETKDSEWASYTFVRAVESGLKYKLINSNTEYEVIGSGTASGEVIIDDFYRGKPVTSIADKAFYNNHSITGITVGANVRTIGNKAFSRCTELTYVQIPEGVTYIGEYAFQSSKQLVSANIPSTVTEIPPYMFSFCTALENLTIGSSITTVGEYAFSNCIALRDVVLPETVTSVGQYAFSDCESLKSIKLSNAIATVGEYAFSNCLSLAAVNIPTSLEIIAPNMFTGCQSLLSVTIPDSVKTVSRESFAGCTLLNDVTIGKGVTSIGKNAFIGTAVFKDEEGNDINGLVYIDGWVIAQTDKNITKIVLPEGIYGFGSNAFEGCEKLEQVELKGIKYVGTSAFYKCTSMYECVFDDSLIEIGATAFSGCTYLDYVEVGKALEVIGDSAFYGCTMLASLDLPDTVKKIGGTAFKNTLAHKNANNSIVVIDDWIVGTNFPANMGIMGLAIPEGIRGISNYAFNGLYLLGNLVLPESLEYIGRSAFYEAMMDTVNIPSGIKEIGDYAFYGCARTLFGNKGALIIPRGTESIGRSAFYGCPGIISLVIPSTVKTVGDFAFYKCESIGMTVEDPENPMVGYVIIENGVEHIGNRAFQGCISITDVSIPNSVTYLGSHLFYKCTALQNVTIGSSVTEIQPYTFFNCAALENVKFSNDIKKVGNYAFKGCELLKSVALPSVEHIGDYAFYKCKSISELTISATLKTIGNYAFRNCLEVKTVIIPKTVVSIGKHAFYGMNSATLYCETDSIPSSWNERFNSSYRPIIWGCELSEDNSYVASFTVSATNPDNLGTTNKLENIVRDGYEFAGWATVVGGAVVYTSENVNTAPEGTTVYAIWTEVNGEETE